MRTLSCLVFLASLLLGQLPTVPVNLNFESGELGRVPAGWSFSGSPPAGGASAVVVNADCYEGAHCALLKGPDAPPSNWFGTLTQGVNASPNLNKRIRYRAAVRVEGAETYAQLWLRVDRRTGGFSFFDNMSNRPITSSAWAKYTIDGFALDDSAQIYFGVIIRGFGRVWVDDVSIETIGQVRVDAPEPARALSDTGLANLVAFAKVYGYGRFFNPSDQAATADWETIAVEGSRLVEDAVNQQELAERIQTIFDPVAPTVHVYAEGSRLEFPPELAPASRDGLKAVRWRHFGVQAGLESGIYRSTREWSAVQGGKLPAGWIDPADAFDAAIGRGLRVLVPLTVYADEFGTTPWRELASTDDLYIHSAANRSTRLAAVIVAWNVIQHFFPYFDVTDVDWPAELVKALRSAATDTTPQEFQKTLRRLWASLKDGHGNVSALESFPAVPLVWDWVENQLIVTRVKQEQQSGIQRGDRVVSVDGKDAASAIAEIEALTSGATPQWIRWRALVELAYCPSSTRRMRLEIEPFGQPGTRRSVELACGADYDWSEQRPDKVAELEPGVFYVDIDRITDADWRAALPRLAGARAIVFDLRGYPRGISYLFHFAAEGVIDSAQWHIPTPEKPDRIDLTFRRDPGWNLKPVEPYLRAKKVFLTDGRAISFAESVMGIIEAYKFAEIVGSTTAGTNGNVNVFNVPGGFRLVFTGMKVVKHDGSQHHGVGIAPTIPLSRTRTGVAAGKDEVLLGGIEAARQP